MRNSFNLIQRKLAFLLTFSTLLLVSCEQPEGYGGSAAVRGHIISKYYSDDFGTFIRSEPAIDEEVFLLFGDDENLGDRVFTSLTGSFAFEYLRPGSYTLYFMTEDSTIKDRDEHTKAIEFDLKNGEDLDLGEIEEFKTLDFDEGTGKIYGVIRLINYTNESVFPFLEVKDTSFAQEHEVYLIYGDHDYFDERIRTNYNGYFEFPNLIPGNYEIFTYSEDISGGTQDDVQKKIVSISDSIQEVDLGTLFIEQL